MRRTTRLLVPLLLATLGLGWSAGGVAAEEPAGVFEFDDFPLEDLLEYPPWFKKSFLDLQEDLAEAEAAGKKGIIVYFGQKRCAYCKMLMDVNFKLADIVSYTRRNFDVIPIDIWSPEELTDPEGNLMSEREYAVRLGTNFTPSLIFYDFEGRIALRLRGYYPPYQFRAALEYVAGDHYQREPFAVYMARGDSTQRFEKSDLNEQDFFIPPPHNLDRSRFPAERPLVVFFEQGDCHACDVLHTQPLRQPTIHKLFEQFDTVQLDMWSDTPVMTPEGRATTSRQWAQDLGLFYAPSILFFDEHGKEIIRVDSVVRFFRLRNVLNYVISRGYESYPSFQSWRVNSGL
jgi:thioredoxin-related protein